ncbi:MAG TPA: peptidoglycan editing factor PgeF [Firmicutes bacterium]|jgi:YfiH family protein|nr:peptidoglycan editing factor PgeF [Bacillota bacterium]
MPWEQREVNGVRYYRSQLLAQFPWLEQGFSTRAPVSPVTKPGVEEEYRRRFFALFGLTPDRIQMVRQVHGDRVLVIDRPQPGLELPEADAMITNQPGVGLATIHADCVPVVLVDPVRRVIAAVHAGWKGTLAGIVGQTIKRMEAEYGSKPADCWAAIGPAVGSCCYRVSRERIKLFQEKWPGLDWRAAEKRGVLDLAALNQQCLEKLGVRPARIDPARLCTACRDTDFYSFRREQTARRMLSLIMMK